MRPGRVGRPLSPGALADRLSTFPVTVESHAVDLGSVEVTGYYDGAPRPTGVVTLTGHGVRGRGECVAWTAGEQETFAEAVARLAPRGTTTVGGVAAALDARAPDRYHRSAVETATLDLALRQAGTNPYAVAGRPVRDVRYCWSLGADAIADAGGPVEAVRRILADEPGARLKIDVPVEGWPDTTWHGLAESGRVVVVDFKRDGQPSEVVRAHAHLPWAWLEDPPLSGAVDGAWATRLSLDRPVVSSAALVDPPFCPAAINVKAPRIGGWLEALACLETASANGWRTYVGGMFEVDVGRQQARVLASLFSPDAWNDLAPLRPTRQSPHAPSPAAMSGEFVGLAPETPSRVRT